MPNKNELAMSAFRLDQARRCLQAAELVLSAGMFKDAANRSYYCIFHAIRATLALRSFDSKKHSGVISEFHKNYINAGLFPKALSKILDNAFKVRNDSDYLDFYIISKDKVTAQVENAKTFLAAVEEYLSRVAPEALTMTIDDDDDLMTPANII